MPPVHFHNISAVGIISDTPAHLLPPEAWSNGRNVRFYDGRAVKFLGHKAVFDPPTVAPHWALSVTTKDDVFWVYASLAEVYAILGSTHGKITRASGSYGAGAALIWNGGLLAGIPILNNGTDVPQYWPTVELATNLADLSNWQAGVTARVVRPHLPFLVALNITKVSPASPTGNFPHMIKWSHPADPGALPTSWDETDATKDAGEAELTDVQSGIILDGLSLGTVFIIYKESSTHGMRFIGGQNIWAFFPISLASGILSTSCVVPTPDGKRHFVATGSDLGLMDGRGFTSVVEDRLRRFLVDNIDTDNFDRSFCFANRRFRENWFCFPESGSTWPTLAAVWSERDNTVTIREIADVSFIASGKVVEASDDTWDADAEVWDDDPSTWDATIFSPTAHSALACDPVNTKLLEVDRTEQFAGVSFTAFLEREGLAVIGQDRQGNPKVDVEVRKLVTRVWPKVTGGPIIVRVGVQDKIGGTITFSPNMTFDPAAADFVDLDPPLAGRLITVRFETAGADAWELHGYDLDISLLGRH